MSKSEDAPIGLPRFHRLRGALLRMDIGRRPNGPKTYEDSLNPIAPKLEGTKEGFNSEYTQLQHIVQLVRARNLTALMLEAAEAEERKEITASSSSNGELAAD